MPFVSIPSSPLIPGLSPVPLYYRELGCAAGIPVLFMHGGWGYEVYPFDKQLPRFAERFRVLIPDRSGYGRSSRISQLPVDFHERAASEMISFLDALHIERPVLWGHSDGSVIAIKMALKKPERFSGLILEAFHYFRVKEGSEAFFEAMSRDPDSLGEKVCTSLAREHGEDYWREIILLNGDAWLQLNRASTHPKEDLYGGRLSELKPPAIFIHGAHDPRTEPDELDAVRAELPGVRIHLVSNGAHSPHSQSAAASETADTALNFIEQLMKRL